MIALFIALGGVGYAATAVPESSVGTKQLKKGAVTLGKISKSARRALRGVQGQAGIPGQPGATGQAAAASEAPLALPSGRSESGTWGAADTPAGELIPITFSPPLAGGLPEANLHFMGATTSTTCPGAGQAASGHLCVYAAPGRNDLPFGWFDDPITGFNGNDARTFGVNIYLFSGAESNDLGGGSWTVTAP